MAVYLKTLVVGDSQTGKTTTCKLLSAGRRNLDTYEAAAYDPGTKT
jgi:hypothetical protein